jgi:hypothetical protein
MDRRDAVLKFLTKDMRGLEIGPWFNPLAPKAEGYNCLVLDVFDSDALRERARSVANVPMILWDRIEDVDVVGSSTHIDELIHEVASSARSTISCHRTISSTFPTRSDFFEAVRKCSVRAALFRWRFLIVAHALTILGL